MLDLVPRILAPYAQKNHRVFMDRRYSSPALFRKLLSLGFLPVGTVQSYRKNLPTVFKDTKLKKGERVAKQCDEMLATEWKDVRDVFMLSTISNGVMLAVDLLIVVIMCH